MPRLTDPWFEASFIWDIDPSGSYRHERILTGAQGLWLWCPCGYGKPQYPLDGGRPHAIIVPFGNPQNAPPVPPGFGPKDRNGGYPRWTVSGTGLDDLSIQPSLDIGDPTCWHSYITNGNVG